MRIIGYGVCGGGEADRYLEATLKCFKDLCDETIILGNNITDKERELIKKYDFHLVEDDREWGKEQHRIKEEFVESEVASLAPDATICLDMDEVLVTTRERIEEYLNKGDAWYVYIVNLWNEGYRQDWSFWNVRIWKWDWQEKLGKGFWRFENRPLHCGLAPKWCYQLNLHAPIMLLHSGLKKKEDRDRKIKRYEKYDPRQVYRAPQYYQALTQDFCDEFDQEEVQRRLDEHIGSIQQPLNKQLTMIKPKHKMFMVVREYDGMTFPVYEHVLESQLKQKFKGMGFKVIEEITDQNRKEKKVKKGEVNPLECEICGFIAKSEDSIKAHKYKTDH